MADFGDVREVTMKALTFVKKYYEVLDAGGAAREPLMSFFNHPLASPGTPLMQWNGHTLNTAQDVESYLSNLPKTKHELRSVDAQPLPGSTDADSYMITVNGRCVYDDEHTRYFYERIIVAKHKGLHYIVNAYYRWTGEEIK